MECTVKKQNALLGQSQVFLKARCGYSATKYAKKKQHNQSIIVQIKSKPQQICFASKEGMLQTYI
eukprot:m.193969 g.193969  ORF g.193969 m.193969 type:complete len:65 (-) comp13656_c0_seq34:759-953(-)